MKKIMFNDRYGLTKAVLNGTKTMTRRVMKVPLTEFNAVIRALKDDENIEENKRAIIKKYAHYQIGETVAVAQAYQTLLWPALPGIDWKAITDEVTHSKGWTNKMFVKAEYMPHRIRITNDKLERLQDISDEDCMKEGILFEEPDNYHFLEYGIRFGWRVFQRSTYANNPRAVFADLIDRISGKGTWNSNPWVFVYEFELVK